MSICDEKEREKVKKCKEESNLKTYTKTNFVGERSQILKFERDF